MKIKQTLLLLTLILSLCGSFFVAGAVSAAQCAGVETSVIECDDNAKCADGSTVDADTGKCADGKSPVTTDVKDTGVWSLLLIVINIMTAGIGVVALGGIAYAAVIYASAGGSVEKVRQAIKIIMNVVIGAVMYAIAYSLLNWLIPGGAF